MKNKNLLAENMLRFKAKNLSETAKQNIVELARIITEQSDYDFGDVDQGKKETWNFGYRPGTKIERPFGYSQQGSLPTFTLVSSDFFYKPSEDGTTPGSWSGRIVLKSNRSGAEDDLVTVWVLSPGKMGKKAKGSGPNGPELANIINNMGVLTASTSQYSAKTDFLKAALKSVEEKNKA